MTLRQRLHRGRNGEYMLCTLGPIVDTSWCVSVQVNKGAEKAPKGTPRQSMGQGGFAEQCHTMHHGLKASLFCLCATGFAGRMYWPILLLLHPRHPLRPDQRRAVPCIGLCSFHSLLTRDVDACCCQQWIRPPNIDIGNVAPRGSVSDRSSLEVMTIIDEPRRRKLLPMG